MANTMDKLAKELKNAMTASDERKPKPYDAQAEVLRVENDIAWVHIPGGVEETPVRLTINAKKGDMVNIHVANGSAWITGNGTNPPTDDTTANYAVDISNNVKKDVTILNTVVVENIEATNARFENVEADTIKVHDLTADQLTATVGYIGDLTADHITTSDISAATGFISDLTADNITASDISADHATVGNLDATYASITSLTAATGRIDNLEANEVIVNDTLEAANANIEYLKSDWISTDRLVLTGNNKNNYPPVEITESEFNVNKTAYWTKNGDTYTQCTSASVYDADTQYYVRQTVQSIIEAINTANNTDPQVIVSNDKLIAASMDVAELSAITADMGTLTAGKIQKGNNFINLDTSPATMEFKNASTWTNATQGLQWDTQGNLNIKGKVTVTSGSNVPTTDEMDSAIDGIQVGGRNLLLGSKDYKNWSVSGNIAFSTDNPTDIASFPAVTSMSTYQPLIDIYKIDYSQIRNHDCVLSMYVKAANGVVVSIMWQYEVYAIDSTSRLKYGNMAKTVTGTGGWDKLVFNLAIDDSIFTQGTGSPDYNNCEIRMSIWRNPSSSYMSAFQIKCLKLELGNKESDWTPAPEDVEGSASVNSNMLRDWNAPTLAAVNAKTKRYWSGATSPLSCTWTKITNPPETNIVYGARVVLSTAQTSELQAAISFYEDTDNVDLPMSVGNSYTVSCWARVTTGAGRARIYYRNNGSATGVGSITTLSSTWKRIYVVVTPTTIDYGRVWFYANFPVGTTGTVELCGFKCVTNGDSAEATKYVTDISGTGIRVHAANTENNSVVINANGMTVYKGGTTDADSVAYYGDTARIGKSDTRHIEIKDGGMQVYQDANTTLAHLGYGSGNSATGTAVAPFLTLGTRKAGQAVGNYSVGEGLNVEASGYVSHAEGCETTASGLFSHAEGYFTTSGGSYSHAEGSFASSSGGFSHAEGYYVMATGEYSHGEGGSTVASGDYSHAEGYSCEASGDYAHAGGHGTRAASNGQTAIGTYNKADANDVYALIVGNGSSASARSNAFAVTWDGEIFIALGSDTTDTTISNALTTLGWSVTA